jgi:hypothetical protein
MLKRRLNQSGTSASFNADSSMSDPSRESFEEAAGKKQPSLGREILDMLRHNKKWWMIPILVVLLLFGVLLLLGGTGAAPFIYTLF